ncbi:MAG: class I adenylate-forming enzyme family protein [Kiritimatiellia bacterium]|nr:class I adenylate-forming enzyme family protein [Kiritimatiellia bacterium]
MTIRSALEEFANRHPDHVAQVFSRDHGWVRRTYGEFLADVKATAEAYGSKFGLKPREENVAQILANSPEWMDVYLACSGAGVSVVPLDPKLHSEEVQYILRDSGAVVVTTDRQHIPMMQQIAADLPKLRAIVIVDGGAPSYAAIGSVPVYDLSELKKGSCKCGWYDKHVCEGDDVASIIYTSGTTGKPKGAMLTHANFMADAEGALAAFGERIDDTDSFYVVLPFFHAFSFLVNLILPITLGSPAILMRSIRTISEDLKELQPTVLIAVPLLVEKVYNKISEKLAASKVAKILRMTGLKSVVNANVKKSLDPRLRFVIVGGAPCPVHVLKGFKDLGIKMLEGYGLTECSPVVSIAGPKVAKIGTIGHKLPNIEIRIADANEAGVGELQVKGPIVMRGYFNNEAATKDAFDGEWLRTGDLASVDEQGLITIRGRKKALIVNREGKNIYPEEVENVISGDPLIADCVVVGYRIGGDPGEHVGVIVHPNEDALTARNGGTPMPWSEMERVARIGIRTRCQKLADYKRPRKILVLHEPLERTSIQKVRRVAYKGMLDE